MQFLDPKIIAALKKLFNLQGHIQDAEFKEACQLLNKITWTDYERAVYEKKMIDAQVAESSAASYREKGREEGMLENRRATIERMFSLGLDINIIAQATGLTEKEVLELRNDYKSR